MNKIFRLFKSGLLLFGLWFLSVVVVKAQCMFGANSVFTGQAINATINLEQSFIAECTGLITSIDLRILAIISGDATLIISSGPAPSIHIPGQVLHTQSINVNTVGFPAFNLTTPISVVEGQEYSFGLKGSATTDFALGYDIINSFPNGQLYQNGGIVTPVTSTTGDDAAFQINIVPLPPPPPIPTISQWGLLIFGLLLLNLSIFYIRRKEANSLSPTDID